MNIKLYVIIETIYYEKFASVESFIDNDTSYMSWHAAVKSMCELLNARAEQSRAVENLKIDVYEKTREALASFHSNSDVIHYFKVCELDTLDEEES